MCMPRHCDASAVPERGAGAADESDIAKRVRATMPAALLLYYHVLRRPQQFSVGSLQAEGGQDAGAESLGSEMDIPWSIDTAQQEVHWQSSICQHLDMKGRLRVSPHGLNGTLTASRNALEEYSRLVAMRHKASGADEIDWKFSDISEAHMFDALSVRYTPELVSLGLPAGVLDLECTGRHVSPEEWHRLLTRGSARARESGRCGSRGCQEQRLRNGCNGDDHASSGPPPGGEGPPPGGENGDGLHDGDAGGLNGVDEKLPPVLIDVRNKYESDIGHFCAGVANVPTLRPPLRQYSELPGWLVEQLPLLRGRQVLMYCTGGVRCEAASALLLRLLDEDRRDDRGGVTGGSGGCSGCGGSSGGGGGSDVAGSGGHSRSGYGDGNNVGVSSREGVSGLDTAGDPATGDKGIEHPHHAPRSLPSAPALPPTETLAPNLAQHASPECRVLQLRGGIVRYLEAFPDGGCFRGANLVFDRRRCVAPPCAQAGAALLCPSARRYSARRQVRDEIQF